MKETLKSAGVILGGIVFMVLIVVLFATAINGTAWLSEKALPAINYVTIIGFAIVVMIALPASFFRPFRALCAWSFLLWSYLCGISLWMCCLLLTLNLWGVTAVIIGLLMAGVGVIPMAILATSFKFQWSFVLQLLLQLILCLAARIYGYRLLAKAETDTYLTEIGK